MCVKLPSADSKKRGKTIYTATQWNRGSMKKLPIHIAFKLSVLKMAFTQQIEVVTKNYVLFQTTYPPKYTSSLCVTFCWRASCSTVGRNLVKSTETLREAGNTTPFHYTGKGCVSKTLRDQKKRKEKQLVAAGPGSVPYCPVLLFPADWLWRAGRSSSGSSACHPPPRQCHSKQSSFGH